MRSGSYDVLTSLESEIHPDLRNNDSAWRHLKRDEIPLNDGIQRRSIEKGNRPQNSRVLNLSIRRHCCFDNDYALYPLQLRIDGIHRSNLPQPFEFLLVSKVYVDDGARVVRTG